MNAILYINKTGCQILYGFSSRDADLCALDFGIK